MPDACAEAVENSLSRNLLEPLRDHFDAAIGLKAGDQSFAGELVVALLDRLGLSYSVRGQAIG